MADIFISYAREDRDRVKPLANALANQGWVVFWDQNIPVGKKWDEVIEEELNAAKCVIVVFSKNSTGSEYVKDEAMRGKKRDILIPVLIEDVEIPLFFSRIQSVELINWQQDSNHPQFRKLISDLSWILGASPQKVKQAEEERPQKKRFGQRMRLLLVIAAILLTVSLTLAWYFVRVVPKVKTHLTAGNQLLNQGYYHAAEEHFRKAKQIDRSNADAHIGLQKIELYRLVKSDTDPVVVKTEIRQFLEQYPDDPHAYLFLGDLFVNSAPNTAIKHYQKAMDIDPDLAEAWFSLGYVHGTHFEDYDKALIEYRRAVALSPHNSRYITNLASILCKIEKFEACIENYEKVIDLNSYSFITYIKLIEVLRLLDKAPQSVPYVKALAKFSENDANWQKPINRELWGIAVNDSNGKVVNIQLHDVNEKKFYVYCQISLTFFLLGREDEGREYARKAGKVESVDKETLIKLIAWDIYRLKENQPQFNRQLENCWEELPIK